MLLRLLLQGGRLRSPEELPDFLTHYYRETPFRSLTHLTDEEAAVVVDGLDCSSAADFRLTQPQYLRLRREVESKMRRLFVDKGGRPELEAPHYAVLGTAGVYEDDPRSRKLRLPLDAFEPALLSFTFTDSFFAFHDRNLRGVSIPKRPYHRQVFGIDELPALIDQYGWPGDRWKHEPDRRFDVYIEAQIWREV